MSINIYSYVYAYIKIESNLPFLPFEFLCRLSYHATICTQPSAPLCVRVSSVVAATNF